MLAAVAILTKYISVLLLISCLTASFLHPKARRYYCSSAPYVTVFAFLLLLSPHVCWAIANDLPTVEYALYKTWEPRASTSYRAVVVTLVAIAAHGVVLLGFWMAFRRETPHLLRKAALSIEYPSQRWVWTLALGPFILTLVSVLVLNVKLSPQFLTPLFFLVPTAVLAFSCGEVTPQRLRSIASLWVGAAFVCAIVALPLSYAMFRMHLGIAKEPRRELAWIANEEWVRALALRRELLRRRRTTVMHLHSTALALHLISLT